MSNKLDKIINLIKKTGDKALILDENGEPKYVIMTVSGYEQLILGKSEVKGLTEDEFLDKINRDIEVWKDNQENEHLPVEQYDFSRKLHEKSSFGPKFFDFNEFNENNGNFDDLDKKIGFKDKFEEKKKIRENEDDNEYYFEPVE